MAESVSGILALAVAVFVLMDAWLMFASYVYSRYIFYRYLKKNHKQEWEKLVSGSANRGPNLFSFDKTRELSRFRVNSNEDFGDPDIRKMRKLSIYLFKIGIWGWLLLVIGFAVVGILVLLTGA